MANLNKFMVIGRLTADPELRYTAGQKAVTDLRLATNRHWTTGDGERREETLFIDATAWGRTAENCCKFLKKGSQVFVEGYLRLDTWDDKQSGEKRSKIKGEVENVQFLDGPQSSNGPAPQERQESAPAPRSRGTSTYGNGNGNPQPAPVRRGPQPMSDPDEPDDDIPF